MLFCNGCRAWRLEVSYLAPQAAERKFKGDMDGLVRGEKARGDALEGELERLRRQVEQDRLVVFLKLFLDQPQQKLLTL